MRPWGLGDDDLTSGEAAEQLGYTVQHVRRLIREGKLAGVKLGRDWIISTDSVHRYQADQNNLDLPLEPWSLHAKY